jgi:tetratricopeptide (TPR) repeat protein
MRYDPPCQGWNYISSNSHYGVLAYSGCNPKLGDYSYPGNNTITSNGNYEIYNGSSQTIFARYNWWQYDDGPRKDYYGSVTWTPANPPSKGESDQETLTEAQYYNHQGTDYLLEGQYLQAIQFFQFVITTNPESEDAQYALSHLAWCYEGSGKTAEVVPYLEGIAAKYDKQGLGGFARALSVPYLEKTTDYQKAVDRCNEVREFYQDKEVTKNLLFIMGNIYFYGLVENEKAKQIFEEFIKAYPGDPLANTAQAMLGAMDSRALPKPHISENEAVNNLPTDFALSQNYPNPFNPETEIRYQLPENCQVSLVVYNLLGQRIRTLLDSPQPMGFHSVRWDGKDDQGQVVASGVYLYLMTTKQFRQVEKMLLLR